MSSHGNCHLQRAGRCVCRSSAETTLALPAKAECLCRHAGPCTGWVLSSRDTPSVEQLVLTPRIFTAALPITANIQERSTCLDSRMDEYMWLCSHNAILYRDKNKVVMKVVSCPFWQQGCQGGTDNLETAICRMRPDSQER